MEILSDSSWWTGGENLPPPPPHTACRALLPPPPPLSSLRSSVSISNSGCSHRPRCSLESGVRVCITYMMRDVCVRACSAVIRASTRTRCGSVARCRRCCCSAGPESRRTRSKSPGWTRPRTRRGNTRSPSPPSPRSCWPCWRAWPAAPRGSSPSASCPRSAARPLSSWILVLWCLLLWRGCVHLSPGSRAGSSPLSSPLLRAGRRTQSEPQGSCSGPGAVSAGRWSSFSRSPLRAPGKVNSGGGCSGSQLRGTSGQVSRSWRRRFRLGFSKLNGPMQLWILWNKIRSLTRLMIYIDLHSHSSSFTH